MMSATVATATRSSSGSIGRAAVRQQRVGQGLDQLERHASAAQIVARVAAVRSPGVDQRVAVGQLVRALVVVGNDQIDAELAGQSGGGVRGGAAVRGDDDVCAGVGKLLDDGRGQAVAVDEAIRQAHVGLDAHHAQTRSEHGGGVDAVGVVVGEDGDVTRALGPRVPADRRLLGRPSAAWDRRDHGRRRSESPRRGRGARDHACT